MKRSMTLAAITILALALFFGCTKNNTPRQFSMKAQLTSSSGTNSYEVQNCMAKLTGTTMEITGLGSSSNIPTVPFIKLSINNWHEALDTFRFDTTFVSGRAEYIAGNGVHTSWQGLVYINTISPTSISGTFQFETFDTLKITGGSFTAQKL